MINTNAYAEDVNRYLVSKFPFADASTLFEVSEYIGNRTARLMLEVIADRDKEWNRALKQTTRPRKKESENENEN